MLENRIVHVGVLSNIFEMNETKKIIKSHLRHEKPERTDCYCFYDINKFMSPSFVLFMDIWRSFLNIQFSGT